jgi:hypothetical protein
VEPPEPVGRKDRELFHRVGPATLNRCISHGERKPQLVE